MAELSSWPSGGLLLPVRGIRPRDPGAAGDKLETVQKAQEHMARGGLWDYPINKVTQRSVNLTSVPSTGVRRRAVTYSGGSGVGGSGVTWLYGTPDPIKHAHKHASHMREV